jgi:hypothetical protein
MYGAIFTNDKLYYKNTAIKSLDDKLTIKYKKILYKNVMSLIKLP